MLHVDTTAAESWSDEEVVQRWTTLYKAPLLVTRWLGGELKSKAEINKTLEVIDEWRGLFSALLSHNAILMTSTILTNNPFLVSMDESYFDPVTFSAFTYSGAGNPVD
ncbi:hypothetical protein VTH8203_03076 [Vibrio thalassae]|uniref:Uncharacterized protein n=1 Tax=Vibrio thalassae TaxID=1243014 RepID=A0A240EMN7_9VIBR|nr:hypothetical protein [Vibrio thalassae]SNX49429.1 hypothetical protein VTH8203_03076 [Vibrio thalassae]